MRPATGQSFGGLARPGTGQRMGTAQAFGMGGAAPAMGARPGTQQGLMGLRPSTGGPGRQVQDVTYFVGVLRNGINDITAEISRLRAETEHATRDMAAVAGYEQQYETLVKEVRALEGDLADYNLAMDKARTNTAAPDVAAVAAMQKRRNEAAAREADACFMERAERERGSTKLEEHIVELARIARERIDAMDPEQAAEYRALQETNASLGGHISVLQGELEAVNGEVEAAEAEISRDRVRDDYALHEKRLQYLRRERTALEAEMGASGLDPGEARERLLARVKADNARIQATDRRLREIEEEIEGKRRLAADLAAQVESRQGDNGDAHKYEVLFQRDQEMTEFIERFPSLREKEVGEQRRLQASIAETMEAMGAAAERERAMPSKEQAEGLKADLSDKERNLEVSRMTSERLKEELALRSAELQKISELDGRISEELAAIRARSVTMQEEMANKFSDITGLRTTAERTKSTLVDLIKAHTARRNKLKSTVAALAADLEKRRAALLRDPQATALDALEAKLKLAEQNGFQLREYIAVKGRESEYESLKLDAMRLVGEINLIVQRTQTALPRPALSGM